MHQCANAKLKLKGKMHDTVVLAKIADENRKSFELKEIAALLPGGIVKFEYMVDNYKDANKIADYRSIPRELLTQYGGADVINCFTEFFHDLKIVTEQNLLDLYNTECDVMMALYAMERYGCKVDVNYEKPLAEELQRLSDEAEQAIYDEAGYMFNINSTKQLYDALVATGVNSAWIPTTDKGNPSLSKDVLNTLSSRHKVNMVNNILSFRKYEKLLVTYATGIYAQKDIVDKVHGNINQTEATTGRMSITKPALQTLPKKDKRIRRAFVPDEDYSLWFMDLDQIEYRLFAHYAKIDSLLDSIKNGHDVHGATAAMLNGMSTTDFMSKLQEYEELSNKSSELLKDGLVDNELNLTIQALSQFPDKRSRAKTVNFALLYGVGIKHLAEMLDITETEASVLKAQYFSQIPEARAFITTVHEVIKMRGFVKNFYGRRRRLDSNDSYKAPNALIQGCAADYIKSKLVNMFKYIQYHKLKTQLILIVHDEVVLHVHKDEHEHLPMFRWMLSDFETYRCPITAGVECGKPSWGQKVVPDIVDFKKPDDMSYLNHNIYDGALFNI